MAIFRGTGGQGDSTTDTTVTTVTEKAAEAASSATSAADSATSAANSASSASTSETNAATSETNAATSATNSATSATNSATSATSASTSATTATTKASEASASATTAATSATAAQTAQTAAEAAQTAAETAETNAETAEANTLAIFGDAQDVQDAVDDAEKLAINPEDSQYTLSDGTTTGYSALHHAAKAEDHKTAAEVSKNAAETAETAAETAQGLAETAKTAAETAQSAAETAQAAAELAQSNAETVYDDFDDRYLGTKSGDPLVDNDNEGLTTGTLYFNTTENEMRVYTGTAWVAVVDLAGDITVNSLTSNNDVVVKGNLEVQGTTITVDSATAQTIDLGDNDKIRLGDSDDLQIYHDGLNSYIHESGTGSLFIQAYAGLVVRNPIATEKILEGYVGGAVSLYYDNAKKLATTSSGVDVTGNITVSGTVDGRDVAADGATLDAVASTYVDVSGDTLTGDLAFGDNVKAKFGASNDLQIYHTGTNSIINEVGAGNLVLSTNGTQVRIAHSTNGETMAEFNKNGSALLKYDGANKLETTSSGVTVDGDVTITQSQGGTFLKFDVDGTQDEATLGIDASDFIISNDPTNVRFGSDIVFKTDGITAAKVRASGDFELYEDTGTTAKLTWDASAEELQFKDNVKAEFGDGGDLKIYHDGTHSYVEDNGIGNLRLKGFNVQVVSSGNETMALFIPNQGASLWYNNSKKIETTSSGVDVTGTLVSDGLTVGTAQTVGFVSADVNISGGNAADSYINLTRTSSDANSGVLNFGKTSAGSAVSNSHFLGAIQFCGDDGTDINTAGARIRSQVTGTVASNTIPASIIIQTAETSSGPLDRLKVANTGDISFYEDTGTTAKLTWDASAEELQFKDGVKAEFGDGGDLELYSDGTNGIIKSSVTQEYRAVSHSFESTTGGTTRAVIDSTGIDVTGTVTADGLTVDGDVLFDKTTSGANIVQIDALGGNNSRLVFSENNTHKWNIGFVSDGAAFTIYHSAGNSQAFRIAINRDISFYDDSGTSQDFYWDASTSRLGLGTTAPTQHLEVSGSGTQWARVVSTDASGAGLKLRSGGSSDMNIQDDVGVLKFSRGSTEQMRLDSSGRLGLGTTNPTAKLDVEGQIRARQGGSEFTDLTYYGIDFYRSFSYIRPNTDGTKTLSIGADSVSKNWEVISHGASNRHVFNIGASEAMRIDSSGNVGIGTTSPSALIDVYNTNSSSPAARFYGNFQTIQNLRGFQIYNNQSNGSVDTTLVYGNIANSYLAFGHHDGTSYSERMRLDSSGNLLVGGTNAFPSSNNVVGSALKSNGQGQFSRDGGTVLNLNRKTSDGTIAEFRQDGSTVGSIGTYNDQLYIGRDDTGIRFTSGDDALLPVNANSGVIRSGNIDLGKSYGQFRNLYLSGGVYLGGTGSANLLDDYEEGTWTPVVDHVSGFSSATITQIDARYTKIGRQVTLEFQFSLNSSSGNVSAGDDIVLTSGCLPFSPSFNAHAVGTVGSQTSIGIGEDVAMGYAGLSANDQLAILFHTVDGTTQRSSRLGGVVSYFTDA